MILFCGYGFFREHLAHALDLRAHVFQFFFNALVAAIDFYAGSPLVVHVIEPAGSYSSILLGSDPEAGQTFQAVVRAGCWFASHVADWKSWALVGCTVAPGFEFADFEMARREELSAQYPQHREMIRCLTREG